MDPTKDQADQPAVATSDQTLPVSPAVGVPGKEVEPLSHDLVSPHEKKIEISAELNEIGVKEVPQAPQLPQEHARVEVRVSDKPTEPVTYAAPSNFKSPLTQVEIAAAKKNKISDAITWLANTVLRQIKKSKFNQEESLQKPI